MWGSKHTPMRLVLWPCVFLVRLLCAFWCFNQYNRQFLLHTCQKIDEATNSRSCRFVGWWTTGEHNKHRRRRSVSRSTAFNYYQPNRTERNHPTVAISSFPRVWFIVGYVIIGMIQLFGYRHALSLLCRGWRSQSVLGHNRPNSRRTAWSKSFPFGRICCRCDLQHRRNY